MQLFDYPFITIVGLILIALLTGCVGLYFTMKSARVSKHTVSKGFCSMGELKTQYAKDKNISTNRCLVYVSVSLDSMKRLYSESRANHMYEQIKGILLHHFQEISDSEIALCREADFVAFNHWMPEDAAPCIDACSHEINQVLATHGAVSVAHIHFGYHLTSSCDVTFETALERAKQACNIAEDQQMMSCRWDSAIGKEFERKIHMENNIQNEIDNNRFFLEYQPIIDAKTNAIVGAEVLARLNSPTDGILQPDAFLSAINRGRWDQKFDYYIFEKNCKWIAADKEKRTKHVFTTNFSRHTLCDPYFAVNVLSIIQKYGITHTHIAIEILEDTMLDSQEQKNMIRNLTTLKQTGVRVLLDDFGKGNTSFADLTDFDIDIVKIDKAVTQKADQPAGFLILKNLIDTAHNLGFRTLCEGVENEVYRDAAVEAGCDLMQGFYFYRPMSVSQLESLLAE